MKLFILSICVFLCHIGFSQTQGFKLFLIGDTGDDEELEKTINDFLDTISLYPNSATFFLGDNCYKGLKKGFDSSEVTIKRLGAQLNGINESKYKGNVYFIPGNHDWWSRTNIKKGKHHLFKEQGFIEKSLAKNELIKNRKNPFMPMNGDPVAQVELNNSRVRIIFLDTQWLIIQKNKKEREMVYNDIDSLLNIAAALKQNILVAAHHPVYSIGSHSKKCRNHFPKALKYQNMYHPRYMEMRNRIEEILSQKNYPIVYVSGHDHLLEYFHEESVHYIVSGSGSKTNQFNKNRNQDFNPSPDADMPECQMAKVAEGYFEVEFVENSIRINTVFYDGKSIDKQLLK